MAFLRLSSAVAGVLPELRTWSTAKKNRYSVWICIFSSVCMLNHQNDKGFYVVALRKAGKQFFRIEIIRICFYDSNLLHFILLVVLDLLLCHNSLDSTNASFCNKYF